MYVSNENATLVDVYFDDIVMTHTKGNVVQYNEYYPFGLQTANSWTRESNTGNNFLANGGTELNTTSNLYDLQYRNYDPVLGRMNQVDPMATKYASLSPYNFSFNDPVIFNDRNGADPLAYWKQLGAAVDKKNNTEQRNTEGFRSTNNNRYMYGVVGDDDLFPKYGSGGNGALKALDNYMSFGSHLAKLRNVVSKFFSSLANSGTKLEASQDALNKFLKSNFGSAYKKYKEIWTFDDLGKHAKGRRIIDGKETDNSGRTTRNGRQIMVYIGETAFESEEKLYLTIGHEFIHVFLMGNGQMDKWYDEFDHNWDIPERLSEFYAYGWTTQAATKLNFKDEQGRLYDLGASRTILEMFNPESKFYIPREPFYKELLNANKNGIDLWNR